MRPVGPAAKVSLARPAETPFESQDFEDLLSSAREGFIEPHEPTDDLDTDINATIPPGPLDALSNFARIENPGLRQMLAQRFNPAA